MRSKREEKIWNQEEIDLVDKLLLLNKTRTIYRMLSKFNCSKRELDKLINDEKQKLDLRPWEKHEDEEIINNLQGKRSLKNLRAILICLSNSEISKIKELWKVLLKSQKNF